MLPEIVTPRKLTNDENNHLQKVVGILQWFARIIDITILPEIGTIDTNRKTEAYHLLQQKIHQLLDYAATNPNPTLEYAAS